MALFANISRLDDLDVTERRVFVRADLNVPASSFGGVLDDTQLRAVLPTLRALLAKRAKVVVGAHYGHAQNPGPRNAVRCVARRLSELLGLEVGVLERDFAAQFELLGKRAVALTPNLIDYPEELENDAAFAQRVARSVDVFVGDDLRAARETWASVDAL